MGLLLLWKCGNQIVHEAEFCEGAVGQNEGIEVGKAHAAIEFVEGVS